MADYKPVVIKNGEFALLPDADNLVVSVLKATNGIVSGAAFTTGYHDSFRVAADEQLHFRTHANLSAGVLVIAANDADTLTVPLELRALFFGFTGGGVNIGGTVDPGAGRLRIQSGAANSGVVNLLTLRHADTSTATGDGPGLQFEGNQAGGYYLARIYAVNAGLVGSGYAGNLYLQVKPGDGNPIGALITAMTLFSTGGVNIGGASDPGAGNLAVGTVFAGNAPVGLTAGEVLHVTRLAGVDRSHIIALFGANANSGNYLTIFGDTANGATMHISTQYWSNDGHIAIGPFSAPNTLLVTTGGGVNIGGTVDPGAGNLSCNDLPVSRVLASVAGINAKTAADTILYTVPTGKTLVITSIIVRSTAASGISAPAAASIITGAVVQLWPNRSLTGITVAGAMYTFTPDNTWNIYLVATTQILLRIGTGATGTSQTYSVELLGYLL